jgi:hypothetical protein
LDGLKEPVEPEAVNVTVPVGKYPPVRVAEQEVDPPTVKEEGLQITDREGVAWVTDKVIWPELPALLESPP